MLRREFNFVLAGALGALLLRSRTIASAASRGPLFWTATQGKGRVFLLGFGDAQKGDESWLTPEIRAAFQQSHELWLEVAPPPSADSQDVAANAKADAEYEQLSHEPQGRTFFDELDPQVRERTLAYVAELGVKKESVETQRPWAAYYTINRAFWSHAKLSYEPVYVDEELRKLAISQGKQVRYEMPTGLAFAEFMAAMPQKAQSQYIEWLLDFFDDHKKGFDKASSFGWITGDPAENQRSLDRMRTRMPQLYQQMQVNRNSWWAHKIGELLGTNETYFVAIGELHVLGPDGIPKQLLRKGVVSPDGLRENQ